MEGFRAASAILWKVFPDEKVKFFMALERRQKKLLFNFFGGKRDNFADEALATMCREIKEETAERVILSPILGAKWEKVNSEKPSHGIEIENELLASALLGKSEFNGQEWEMFNVSELSYDSYIKVGDLYFKPAFEGPIIWDIVSKQVVFVHELSGDKDFVKDIQDLGHPPECDADMFQRYGGRPKGVVTAVWVCSSMFRKRDWRKYVHHQCIGMMETLLDACNGRPGFDGARIESRLKKSLSSAVDARIRRREGQLATGGLGRGGGKRNDCRSRYDVTAQSQEAYKARQPDAHLNPRLQTHRDFENNGAALHHAQNTGGRRFPQKGSARPRYRPSETDGGTRGQQPRGGFEGAAAREGSWRRPAEEHE